LDSFYVLLADDELFLFDGIERERPVLYVVDYPVARIVQFDEGGSNAVAKRPGVPGDPEDLR
jgi:hypothetical protein